MQALHDRDGMKLRIRDNSVRLRLTRTEVDTLRSTGRVSATTSFPEGRRLEYALQCGDDGGQLAATMNGGLITVHVPAAVALEWAESDQVSLSGQQVLDDGASLTLLVEKDFACLAPREGEDESDMYPHPKSGEC